MHFRNTHFRCMHFRNSISGVCTSEIQFQVCALPKLNFRCVHFRNSISGVCTSEIQFQVYALPKSQVYALPSISGSPRSKTLNSIVCTSMRLHTQVCALSEVHTPVKRASEVHTNFWYALPTINLHNCMHFRSNCIHFNDNLDKCMHYRQHKSYPGVCTPGPTLCNCVHFRHYLMQMYALPI